METIPPHTTQLQGDLPTPLTHNNSTRVHKTTNVPVVFIARYVMILRGAKSLRGALEEAGPENQDFVKKVKIITYRAIKTTGTLIVNIVNESDE